MVRNFSSIDLLDFVCILVKSITQAGAELGQAHVWLEVIVEVVIEAAIKVTVQILLRLV